MKIIETKLPGCVVIEPAVFGDERGFFFETWNAERFAAHGLPTKFVQSNVSTSVKGVLRGLHYQWPRPQGKLVSVLEGEVYDVAVDIRRGSPTFGQWAAVVLSATFSPSCRRIACKMYAVEVLPLVPVMANNLGRFSDVLP